MYCLVLSLHLKIVLSVLPVISDCTLANVSSDRDKVERNTGLLRVRKFVTNRPAQYISTILRISYLIAYPTILRWIPP